jgi:xylulokinase
MGGGAQSDLWCQVLADAIGKPIVRSRSSEATALGAGVLAAAATGLHPDLPAAIAAMTTTNERFSPGEQRDLYQRLNEACAAYPALRQSLEALARLRRR